MTTAPARAYYVPANDTVHAALEGRLPCADNLPPTPAHVGAKLIPRATLAGLRHGGFVSLVGLLTMRYGARVYLA